MKHLKIFRLIALLSVITASIAHGIHFLSPISDEILKAVHLFLSIGAILYGISRKHLTTWIMVSIILGVLVGSDAPSIAIALQSLSQGFIKVIKTIVGPILIATLVYGIAGHSDLKQVGRMAWKSLVYFYSLTIIALFIGLAAINISQAGAGVDASKIPQYELPSASSAQ